MVTLSKQHYLWVVESWPLPVSVFRPNLSQLLSGDLGARSLEHLRVRPHPLIGDPLVSNHDGAAAVSAHVVVAAGLREGNKHIKKSFLNGPSSASFHLFSIFSNKQCKFYYKLMWKWCPTSIRRRDSNSQPSVYESPPLTTRPGFPPILRKVNFTPPPLIFLDLGKYTFNES